jgi:hypothetical protein
MVRHWYHTNNQKQCKLKRTTCIAPGCDIRTVLWPLCPYHARTLVGIAVKPSTRGCGLFATRNLRSGALLAPYVGHVRTEEYTDAVPSPYLIPNPRDPTMLLDASCRRGYAAMSNHRSDPNCYLNVTIINTKPTNRGNKKMFVYHDGWHIPLVFCRRTLMYKPVVWLVTNRDIRIGEELCIDYGPYASHINGIRHTTRPSLCPHTTSY